MLLVNWLVGRRRHKCKIFIQNKSCSNISFHMGRIRKLHTKHTGFRDNVCALLYVYIFKLSFSFKFYFITIATAITFFFFA